MKATMKLGQDEITEAIKAYLVGNGIAASSVKLRVERGFSDPR